MYFESTHYEEKGINPKTHPPARWMCFALYVGIMT